MPLLLHLLNTFSSNSKRVIKRKLQPNERKYSNDRDTRGLLGCSRDTETKIQIHSFDPTKSNHQASQILQRFPTISSTTVATQTPSSSPYTPITISPRSRAVASPDSSSTPLLVIQFRSGWMNFGNAWPDVNRTAYFLP